MPEKEVKRICITMQDLVSAAIPVKELLAQAEYSFDEESPDVITATKGVCSTSELRDTLELQDIHLRISKKLVTTAWF